MQQIAEYDPTELRISYSQIRGIPRAQQDALLVGITVEQQDTIDESTSAGSNAPTLVGIADGVASTPHAARMSRRLLASIAAAYRQGVVAFNARLIRRAQVAVSAAVATGELSDESASTIVLAEIKNGIVTVLNTGDSRAYLIDRITGARSRLSKDHTSFELLKADGEVPSDAEECDYGSVATGLIDAVTAAPMTDDEFQVHMGYARLQPDHVVLLCSDGVTAHLGDAEIAEQVVQATASGEEPCKRIIELVRTRGASDNTTVVLVEVSSVLRSTKEAL